MNRNELLTNYFSLNKDIEPIAYPWTELLAEKNEFYLFGYGSLINEYESNTHLQNSKALYPALGYGVRRVLNYDPDEIVRSRPIYKDPIRSAPYYAAFNMVYTGLVRDFANGVLRKIDKNDFEAFIKRERGYNLVKIPCLSEVNSNTDIIEAYALCAPEYFENRKLVNNELLPNVPYYKLCRSGASNISKEFLNTWLRTSFLGDGRTVIQWEQDEGDI